MFEKIKKGVVFRLIGKSLKNQTFHKIMTAGITFIIAFLIALSSHISTVNTLDYKFAIGMFVIMLFLALLLALYMDLFCQKVLQNRNDIVLFSIIIILTLFLARCISDYSNLAIPIFFATMLVSILLDFSLALVANFILAVSISFITKGDMNFMYLSLISGSLICFLVHRASKRNRFPLVGAGVGTINVLIILCLALINKTSKEVVFLDSLIVFINGIGSVILAIGVLPFLESVFNIITPIRLLELSNPNQPLIKRLLLEAPGTYHHSLMVGNLSETATEAIGGNALLARVGAYFHDVGKLKRPNFFTENQMADNPHDRMTANLSALVITSHTKDGVDIAKKYKVPLTIRDIIAEHHGTTLVAYFYHKAKKEDKNDVTNEDTFRYDGPKPKSKESAVVMIADCVEAAVRSMPDKTEGKIEGLIRKIIKDKLDDGQLDLCNLTLKDLDEIAKAFMKVFSGFFHAREEYPIPKINSESSVSNDDKTGSQNETNEGAILNENLS